MADSVSVSSRNSYGSRVGNSFKRIFGGILLVIASICLLAWNENDYVQQKKALDEGESLVQKAVIDQINPDLEGKEVHISGETASSAEALQDNVFGIITNDLKLKRTVAMYQWYEESHEECHDNYGGSEDCTTTYTYDTKWSEKAISSSRFYKSSGHENPSTWEYESSEREKQPITLGAYTLASVFVAQLTNYKTINLSEQNVNIPEKYRAINQPTMTQTTETTTVEDNNNNYLYGDSENSSGAAVTETANTIAISNGRFHINGDTIYIGVDPNNPVVGDLKITFSSVKPGTVSVIGKQIGSELSTYTVSNGRGIALLEQGNVSAEDMFLHAQQANRTMTWIIRFIGLLLMFSGFAMMLQFIETLAKVLPFLANIIGVGTRIIALGLTLVVGFVTIGIAWLVARPIVGICCLAVAAGGIFLLKKSRKNKKAENPELKSQDTPEIIES